MSDAPYEWERYLPEKCICGSCDGKERPDPECEECDGTGLWLRAIGHDRIEELEAALREIRDAPVGTLRTTTVREVARQALDGER